MRVSRVPPLSMPPSGRGPARRAPRLRPAVAFRVSLILVVAGLAAGCGSTAKLKLSEGSHEVGHSAGLGERHLASATAPAKAPKRAHVARAAAPRCTSGSATIGTAATTYAAVVPKLAVVHKWRGGGAPVIGRFGRLDINGFRTVFDVVGVHTNSSCKPDWYRVLLSVLPNGTTGWVRAWAISTYQVRSRIVVSLSKRKLTLFRSGKPVIQTPVAVGAPSTPTPTGRFFVNERYVLSDANGPFGPYALGISAHSDVLQHTWVEDGPIGVHGTNEPWSIGQAASHGCIRVDNSVMTRLFPLAPAGTPVVVQA